MILGLPDLQITDIQPHQGTMRISARYSGPRSCAHCGAVRLRNKGWIRRLVRHEDWGLRHCVLQVQVPKSKCLGCGRYSRQELPGILRCQRASVSTAQPSRAIRCLPSRVDLQKYWPRALLHQHQRPVTTRQGVSFIEATREDIAKAKELMDELMRHSLDELPSQTRRLLALVDELVNGECQRLKVERADFRFSRRDVRARTGWGHTQLKTHLHRLEELEYLIVHHGGRGQTFVYELNWSGSEGEKSGASRPQVGGMSGAGRGNETRMNTGATGIFARKPQNGTDTGIGQHPGRDAEFDHFGNTPRTRFGRCSIRSGRAALAIFVSLCRRQLFSTRNPGLLPTFLARTR